MPHLGLVTKTLMNLVEPAVRSRADRLFVLSSGRPGRANRKPNISNYYETGLVVAIYEFLLMSPDLAHLEICHEKPYKASTKPQQVDIWIKPVNGGTPTLIECGDFTPGKMKKDATKMRQLNPTGINWFLAFFREQNEASQVPWKKLKECRGRKGSLKGCHVTMDERFTRSFPITLPKMSFHFGFALIRIN